MIADAVPVLHIDLRSTGDAHVTLRYGWENLNRHEPRSLPLAEIEDLIAVMERDYYPTVLQEDYATTGQRLYRWLDGSDRWLERTLRQRRDPLVALAIAVTGRLAHLPWEVLHDGHDFLVAKKRPTVVPLRWWTDPDDPVPLRPDDTPVPNRALNVLFMATAPEGVQPELNFEQEEARILSATAKQPLFLQVEESGCLTELKDLYESYPQDTFDVVHVTGHAGHRDASPVFLTETDVGDRLDATAEDIADVFGYRFPRLLFLSGCRTGQRMGRGDVPSLAEGLIAAGADAVLGWGRPVLDTDGTAAAAALYQALASAKSLPAAMALTVQQLLKDQARDWHLLRLYVANTLPAALVTPLRTRGRHPAPKPSVSSTFLDMEGRVKVATRESFVGRRRPLQRCLRVLRDPSAEELGVVITGMGGYGKSSLAARICDRLPDMDRRVWVGAVDEPALTSKLAAWLDDPTLRQMVTDDQEELTYRLRRVFRALEEQPNPPKPLLLVLDDFEQNLEADCTTLKPGVAAWLGALMDAITDCHAPHRLLITCRYEFQFSRWHQWFHQPIAKFNDGDWQKKCSQLVAFGQNSPVPAAQQARALRLADGNPRLVEWLDKVLTGADGRSTATGVDVDAVLTRLEAEDNQELREQVLAAALLAQMDDTMRNLLQRGRVFELPVPLEALRDVCDDISGLDGLIGRALALGLLETDSPDPDPTQPDLPVRVPRVLPLAVATDEALAAKAAGVLYRLWWEEAERSTEAQKLEIHRLALAGKVGEVAATIVSHLAGHWRNKSRYREAVALCKSTIPVIEDYRFLKDLAFSEQRLGNVEAAVRHYEKALQLCPAEDEAELASINHHYAMLKANQGDVSGAIALFQQSLVITEQIGDALGKAATLHEMGRLKANQGDVSGAIALYEQSLDIKERIGNVQGKAATLHEMGRLKANQGDVSGAIALYEQSLDIKEQIGDAQGKAATLHEMGRLKANQGDVSGAIALFQQSLAIKEQIGNAQGKAATLHEMGRLKANQGDVSGAIALFQQSLVIEEQIGNAQGKAMTLQWLGWLAASAQQDYETGIRCLQESAEILERIGSPEAANSRRLMERIQQMAEGE
ncbi:tetratricopeptide repeat protein [Leptolyngbya sp. CCY15150]|uniref:tetratricopeptide repeat protein n=1 Tax=Leptolyngbya sp. CCY15150 TaxID=2767772 RepID=UPI00194F44E7|nr:tetratricopeptide repeat protein [Leptolyngbya sp. CCY15150]